MIPKSQVKKGLISRGFAFLSKTLKLYKESKKYDTDCYFVVSTPPFLGYFVKKLSKRAPVVYKLQDVFPDNLIEVKGWSEKNLLVKILRRMERKVYRSASKILVCSENALEEKTDFEEEVFDSLCVTVTITVNITAIAIVVTVVRVIGIIGCFRSYIVKYGKLLSTDIAFTVIVTVHMCSFCNALFLFFITVVASIYS